MTIKNSGNPLSFSEIEDEFGSTPGRKLGSYRLVMILKIKILVHYQIYRLIQVYLNLVKLNLVIFIVKN